MLVIFWSLNKIETIRTIVVRGSKGSQLITPACSRLNCVVQW